MNGPQAWMLSSHPMHRTYMYMYMYMYVHVHVQCTVHVYFSQYQASSAGQTQVAGLSSSQSHSLVAYGSARLHLRHHLQSDLYMYMYMYMYLYSAAYSACFLGHTLCLYT